MPYTWKDNVCCRSIYKVLEADDKLDQFESSDINFEDAANFKVGNLRGLTNAGSSDIQDFAAWRLTCDFLSKLSRETRLDKESPTIKTEHLYGAVYNVFRDTNKSLCQLAEVVDALVKFENETASH